MSKAVKGLENASFLDRAPATSRGDLVIGKNQRQRSLSCVRGEWAKFETGNVGLFVMRHEHITASVSEWHSVTEQLKPASKMETVAQTIAFILFPGFSLLTLAAFLEPLKSANQLLAGARYKWVIVGDQASLECSNGIRLTPDLSPEDFRREISVGVRPDFVLLCCGRDYRKQSTHDSQTLIRHLVRRGIPIGGLGAGSWLMAEAGILEGKRCTVHWQEFAPFAETYPDVQLEDSLFVKDGQVYSCPGEFASFDFALSLVRADFGDTPINSICDQLITDPYRLTDRQRIRFRLSPGPISAKIAKILEAMERNMEVRKPVSQLANECGMSARQMQRLFDKYLNTKPMQYYLEMRLERAKQLLTKTDLPIMSIALSCGFESASHFAKCFKDHYKTTPKVFRC